MLCEWKFENFKTQPLPFLLNQCNETVQTKVNCLFKVEYNKNIVENFKFLKVELYVEII